MSLHGPLGYTLLEQISSDRLGTLFWAVHQQSQSTLWLKVFDTPYTQVPVLQDRFIMGMQALRQFQHQHLVQVYEAGRTPSGGVYVSLEGLSAHSLTTLFQQGQHFPIPLIQQVMRQLLAALEALHDSSQIHGDLRASQIFLTSAPPQQTQVKLLHTGHGWWWSDILRQSSGPSDETALYMAPEQIHGQGFDSRADLYALGVLLAELILGSSLYQSYGPQLLNQATPISTFLLDQLQHSGLASPALLQVVRQALSPDPSSRFSSVGSFRYALEQALQGQGGQAFASSSATYNAAVHPFASHDSLRNPFQSSSPSLDSLGAALGGAQGSHDHTVVKATNTNAGEYVAQNQSPYHPSGYGPSSHTLAEEGYYQDDGLATVRHHAPQVQASDLDILGLGFQASSESITAQGIGSPSSPSQLSLPSAFQPEESGSKFKAIHGLVLLLMVLGCGAALYFGVQWPTSGAPSSTSSTQAKTATIELDSSPRGAKVWVNGKPHTRTTPTTLTGVVGQKLQIVLRKQGHHPSLFHWNVTQRHAQTKLVLKSDGTAPQPRAMKPDAGTAQAQTAPRRAAPSPRVTRRPAPLRKTREPSEPPPPPRIRRRARRVASAPKAGQFSLSLSSVPSGAEVIVEGTAFRRFTPVRLTFKKGTRVKIKIRKQGYQEAYFMWTAESNASRKVPLYKYSWHNP